LKLYGAVTVESFGESSGAGIVKIKMEDRIHKNTFSRELINGLTEAFQFIDSEKITRW
jgi:hypothetical protein